MKPFRLLFACLFAGFLLGLIVATGIHYVWVNTIYREHLEREFDKKLVYYTYEQSKCVSRYKMIRACVAWTQ